MRCPVCRNPVDSNFDLHSEGFYEKLFECEDCSTRWSVNHGIIEIIRDGHPRSFMQGQGEAVENDDYNLRS